MTTPRRQIGPYHLDAVIGTGSFAAVYRATDERLGDTVALKLLGDHHALDPDMRERFITEARALRRIDSPHVVRVHDIGETDQHQPYLVLEHADRGTLAERVASRRADGSRAGPADLLVIARGLGAAVGAIHEADLVHRDLSPHNVLIRSTMVPPVGDRRADGATTTGQVTLLAAAERLLLADLGLCKDLARNSGLTQAAGTDGFRPPEQRSGPAQVDARADLWALSALLVWLATGDPPAGPQAAHLLRATKLPGRLGMVLDVSLAEDPERRHTDVAAWLADVETALSPAPLVAGPDAHHSTGPPRPAPPPLLDRVRKLPRPLAAGVLAGVVIGAGAATAASSGDTRRGELDRLDDGEVEVVSESGSSRLAITGPSEVAVDGQVELQVETTDVAHWVWLLPDGEVAFDQQKVAMVARSTGTSRVTLVGETDSGERLVVDHDLRVDD